MGGKMTETTIYFKNRHNEILVGILNHRDILSVDSLLEQEQLKKEYEINKMWDVYKDDRNT